MRFLLTDADEVHVQQDILVESQDPQSGSEQELLAVPEVNIPNSACNI